MKSLTQVINENLQITIPIGILDKKSLKTFADKQQEVKFTGNDPMFLVYKVKDGTPYVFFATKKGMQEYLNTTLEKDGKKTALEVAQIKPGESYQTEDGTIWVKLV